MSWRSPNHPPRRRGTILIVAMILIFVIAALALTLGQSMRVELAVSANAAAAREAAVIERGAEQYILAMLGESEDPIELLDESYFDGVPLGAGYFWILRPDYQDERLPLLGLVDESSKLNINAAPYEWIAGLPNMSDALAASIVDWRDEDETPTEGIGAESQAYLSRTPGHSAKNLPFETVEELRIVDGMTAETLWGDATAAPLGAGLADATTTAQPFDTDTYRAQGIFDLVTVWGGEPADEQRLNVNTAALPADQRLQARQQILQLLVETFGEARGGELAARLPNDNVLDIFDWALRLDMETTELAEVEEFITVTPQGGGAAAQTVKVNINWAPREVLLAMSGIRSDLGGETLWEETDVDALLAHREAEVRNNPHSIAWVLDVLEDGARGRGRFITGRGAIYSADILAVSGNGRAFRRVRIVVDATGAAGPQIVYRRDMTDQGWPMDPAVLQSLRQGQGPTMFGSFGR